MKNNNKRNLLLILASLFLIIPSVVSAVDINANSVDLLQLDFFKAVNKWYSPLAKVAIWLLFVLSGISLVWMMIQLILKNADLQEILVELIRFVMIVGFALWLLLPDGGGDTNVRKISTAVLSGWLWIGGVAVGGSDVISPGGIFELGLDVFDKIYSNSEGLEATIVNGFIGLVLLLVFSLITAVAFLIEIEVMVVTAAGVVLLGFMGNSWAGDYASNYLKYWLSSGVKLFVLYLVVGTGERFISDWAKGQVFDGSAVSGELIGISIILLILVQKIPEMVQGLVSGSSLSSSSIGSAAGMAKTAASVGAGAIGGAAMGAAGGAILANETMNVAAKAHGETGSGVAAFKAGAGAVGSAAGRHIQERVSGGYRANSGSALGSLGMTMRAMHQADVDVMGNRTNADEAGQGTRHSAHSAASKGSGQASGSIGGDANQDGTDTAKPKTGESGTDNKPDDKDQNQDKG